MSDPSANDGESLGIIGVGHLAAYVVRGLRRAGDGRAIYLSPRNAATAASLAHDCACRPCASNEEVLRHATVVIVATPVHACVNAIGALSWTPDHVLLSMVAGIGLEALSAAVPLARIVRALPAPSISFGVDTIPIVPPDPRVQHMLRRLGTVVPIGDEGAFTTVAAAGLCQLWTYGLIEAVATAVQGAGCPRDMAVDIVAGHIGSAAAYIRATKDRASIRASLDAEARPGTLTLAGLEILDRRGAFSAWVEAYERVLALSRHLEP